MITRIEAHNFRCLREVKQSLRPFQILVGPNASGKSAFMDALAFLSTLVSDGLQAAAAERTQSFHDLVWGRAGYQFELAVQAQAPPPDDSGAGLKPRLSRTVNGEVAAIGRIRYYVKVRIDSETNEVVIAEEIVTVESPGSYDPIRVIERELNEARFESESGGLRLAPVAVPWNYSALTGHYRSAAVYVPVTEWLAKLLAEGIQRVSLDPEKLRKPSPPYHGKLKTFDGSQLAPWVDQLEKKSPESFNDWLAHVQTALPDLEGIRAELTWDQHRYLMLRYKNGVELPSWTVSDGTLRLLALTILAYMPEADRTYLVEEPENGVHPTAIDAIYQSLSSIYEGQVLVASQSPILLNLAKPEELLCFVRTNDGTEVVAGDQHPILMNWKGEVALSDLFAGGVLS
jgi:predicted ATPase